jgi:RNA polymerase sigma-70 factor (ECF subfamily)
VNEKKRDGTTRTLGDLLYADVAKTRISERDWVELIHSIAAGDQVALLALYERSHRIVFTLITRMTGNRHAAEELTIDVFHDVWRRASKYDASDGTVLGWILNQARSRAIDRLQPGRQLHAALSALTPQERQAIEAAFFSESTYAEVAARLDEPPGTIKTRIRCAVEKLRQVLTTGEGAQ